MKGLVALERGTIVSHVRVLISRDVGLMRTMNRRVFQLNRGWSERTPGLVATIDALDQ